MAEKNTFTEQVKLFLRIKNDAYDTEVEALIESAKADLQLAGVDSDKQIDNETDPLIERAIEYYCKANFGYDEQSETFGRAYSSLKDALSLSMKYRKSEKDV